MSRGFRHSHDMALEVTLTGAFELVASCVTHEATWDAGMMVWSVKHDQLDTRT